MRTLCESVLLGFSTVQSFAFGCRSHEGGQQGGAVVRPLLSTEC